MKKIMKYEKSIRFASFILAFKRRGSQSQSFFVKSITKIM